MTLLTSPADHAAIRAAIDTMLDSGDLPDATAGLGDVFPRNATDDAMHRTKAHLHLTGKGGDRRFAGCEARAQLADFIGGQLGLGPVLAATRTLRVTMQTVIATVANTPFADGIRRILGSGAKKKVVRAHASAVITAMTDKQAIGNRPVMQFPRNAVSEQIAAVSTTASDDAIAGAGRSASPDPTNSQLLDFGPKAFSKRATVRARWAFCGNLRAHCGDSFRGAIPPADGTARGLHVPSIIPFPSQKQQIERCLHGAA